MKILNLKLHWQILIGMLLGFIYGILIPEHVKYIEWTGVIFLRLLKMVVVPLVLTSLISGVSNINTGNKLRQLSIKTIIYYLGTSLLAILTGLFFVNLFKPGIGNPIDLPSSANLNISTVSVSQTLFDIIPENIFQSILQADMLSIIFISILIGFFITLLPENPKGILSSFFSSAFELMMKITVFIIRLAPVGILGIIARVIAEQSNLFALAINLLHFVFTFFAGLSVHFFISLPIILYFFFKINPIKHIKAMLVPLLMAFSTASSNATLPVTIEHVEIKSGVSNKITGFTLPLGATINMDGTALYELVVAVFVAQLYGIELSFTQQFIIVYTALLASIGTAGIPMASYAAMTIIFTAVGLPLEAVALILPIDRPLDMCRTATNVWSDTCGAVIIAKTEGEKINY